MAKKSKNIDTMYIDISARTIFKLLGITALIVVGLLFIYQTLSALTLIIVSFFLALALNPPVSYIASKLPSGSRGTATALSYSVVLFLLGFILYATIPPLVNQTQNFISDVPNFIQDIRTGDGFVSENIRRYELEDKLLEIQENLSASNITDAGGPVLSFFQRLSGSAVALLTILVLTFFMLVEGPKWIEKFWNVHPKTHRAHRQHIAKKMYSVVVGYVNGQLLVAFIASMSALVMMTVLKLFGINIPFIIPLAAIVGLFGLIPLIGATIGSILVVVVALFESIAAAVIMAIFFLVYQQVENNAIQPIIQAKSVELSPLVILISAILGVTVAGLLGAIFAIPIAAWIRILALDYIQNHRHIEKA